MQSSVIAADIGQLLFGWDQGDRHIDGDAFHLMTFLRSGNDQINGESWLFFDTGTKRLFYDADGLGGAAPVLVATLPNLVSMASGDFVFWE